MPSGRRGRKVSRSARSVRKITSPGDGSIFKKTAEEGLFFYTTGSVISYSGADALSFRHLPDGRYRGRYPDSGAEFVDVEVEIRSGQLKTISMLDPREDPYLEKAAGIIPSIIREQSTGIDTITGATISSSAILGAVEDAILKANVREGGDEDVFD